MLLIRGKGGDDVLLFIFILFVIVENVGYSGYWISLSFHTC